MMDNRANFTTAGIVGLAIGVFILAAVLPGAFDNVFNANTTAWDAGTVALWALIPLVLVAGILLYFTRSKGGGAT